MYTISQVFPFIDLTTGMIGTLIALILYVGFSLGLFLTGRSVGLKSAWLAWIPVLRIFVLGAIMDRTLRTSTGKKSIHGILLLLLAIVKAAADWLVSTLAAVFLGSVWMAYALVMGICIGSIDGWFNVNAYGGAIELVFGSTGILIENIPYFIMDNFHLWLPLIVLVAILVVPFCTLVALSVTTTVATYLTMGYGVYYSVSLYYAFAATCPKAAPLNTVLSIFFDFAAPILLPISAIAGRKKAVVTHDEPSEE